MDNNSNMQHPPLGLTAASKLAEATGQNVPFRLWGHDGLVSPQRFVRGMPWWIGAVLVAGQVALLLVLAVLLKCLSWATSGILPLSVTFLVVAYLPLMLAIRTAVVAPLPDSWSDTVQKAVGWLLTGSLFGLVVLNQLGVIHLFH